jgi:malonate-semialdehyde dehydrogenase (acetylating) / methylmalonate-semialdehyde dehydrogenase
MKYGALRNDVGGHFIALPASRPWLDGYDPSSDSIIARVPMSEAAEVAAAVASAREGFPAWSATPIKEHAQVFYRYQALLEWMS